MDDKQHIEHLRSCLRRAAGVIDQLDKELRKKAGIPSTEPNGEAVTTLANANMNVGDDWNEATRAARNMLRD